MRVVRNAGHSQALRGGHYQRICHRGSQSVAYPGALFCYRAPDQLDDSACCLVSSDGARGGDVFCRVSPARSCNSRMSHLCGASGRNTRTRVLRGVSSAARPRVPTGLGRSSTGGSDLDVEKVEAGHGYQALSRSLPLRARTPIIGVPNFLSGASRGRRLHNRGFSANPI